MAKHPAAMERALGMFGLLTQSEATRLVSMSQSTLTFAVTYRAVSSLVVNDPRGTALLGLAVLAAIFVITAVKAEIVMFVSSKLLQVRIDRFLGLCNDVSVQFLSNLIAAVLTSTFSEAESTWWIIVFAVFALALVGHVSSPAGCRALGISAASAARGPLRHGDGRSAGRFPAAGDCGAAALAVLAIGARGSWPSPWCCGGTAQRR